MTEISIPMADLGLQHQSLRVEIDTAIASVLESSSFIGGDACRAFESEFAEYCGARHACGVGNGSDAVYLALAALDVGSGDEVVTTPFTFVATAEAAGRVGARVVFADIEEDSFNIDPDAVEAAISPRTKALIPVHLYGLPADVERLGAIAAEAGLPVVEDAAQAHGAMAGSRRVGTFGACGCFSFFPSKNLGAMGDGGMVVSDDAELIARLRKLADHGSRHRYIHEREGVSSRLDGIQAAILRVKLKHLDRWNERRRRLAERYREALASIEAVALPAEVEGATSVYHQFTIRVEDRDALQKHLRSRGIASAVHYPLPLHLQEAYRHLDYREGAFPRAERAAREVLSIPIYPELRDDQVDLIASEIAAFLG